MNMSIDIGIGMGVGAPARAVEGWTRSGVRSVWLGSNDEREVWMYESQDRRSAHNRSKELSDDGSAPQVINDTTPAPLPAPSNERLKPAESSRTGLEHIFA